MGRHDTLGAAILRYVDVLIVNSPLLRIWKRRLAGGVSNARAVYFLRIFAVGMLGCGAAVLFAEAIGWLYDVAWSWARDASAWVFLFGALPILLAASLAGGWLLYQFDPKSAGSGIPQLKLAFWRDIGDVPFRTVWVKFLAGVITLGGGISLGREGPTVHIAGGLASGLGRLSGTPAKDRRMLCACGAAAGLAAAFNAPMAAVAFVLEEILEDLNSRLVGPALLAALVSVCTLYMMMSPEPVFHLPVVKEFHFGAVLGVLPTAIFASLVGVGFQRMVMGWSARARARPLRIFRMAGWLRPAAGALVVWVLAAAAFAWTGRTGVLSLGYEDLSAALNGGLVWQVILILLAAKLLATVASYATGNCGGIFAPSLFLGAMAGGLCGAGLSALGWTAPGDTELLAVAGMSACLGAVVRAPVTSVLIVFEMTHDFALVPPLMLAGLVSQVVARWGCRHSFYVEALQLAGEDIGVHVPPRSLQDWKRQPISRFASFNVRSLRHGDRQQAADLMRETHFAVFPLVDESGRLEGILSREEVDRFTMSGQPPRFLTGRSIGLNATLADAEVSLLDAPLNLLVITDDQERVVGILTLHDLLRASLQARSEIQP